MLKKCKKIPSKKNNALIAIPPPYSVKPKIML